jgi:hypothetical protein
MTQHSEDRVGAVCGVVAVKRPDYSPAVAAAPAPALPRDGLS